MKTVTFRQASLEDKALIFSWLDAPHVKMHWDNTPEHRNDILHFIEGRTTPSYYADGAYVYWIAEEDGIPFAMLMSIEETSGEAIGEFKQKYLSTTGHTYSLEFMIGSTAHLGKKRAAPTLRAFTDYLQASFDSKADTFLIDPACDNPKAKHVYEQAGFQYVGDFIMTGNVSGRGKKHSLLVKNLPLMPHDISKDLVCKLIQNQFPQYKDLTVKPVTQSGVDNRTYHLGDHLLVRLPSAIRYADQVIKEQKWLPILAPKLPLPIPKPVAMGTPSSDYPWHYSIYQWMDGISLNQTTLTSSTMEQLAHDLAYFLKTLHRIETKDAPTPGLHNFYRGAHLSIYDQDAQSYFHHLHQWIDANAALLLWQKGMALKWNKEPLWIHGDIASGNLLIKDNTLNAVIDFGCMGIGDPACDLAIAWTWFGDCARKVFRETLALDPATWIRAAGWALWKTSFELTHIQDKQSKEGCDKINIIRTILLDFSKTGDCI